jgi:tripartite-type tricarboxylate transporter receptor subunit TctC
MRGSFAIACFCAAALGLASVSPAGADAVSDFYRGKTISLYVSFPPGGGYDIYARVLAPHFSRQIPGNPAIAIKNMEGGSGVKAASYISTVTPQDGTSLGLFLDTLTLGKVLGGPGEFDPLKLAWIGRIVSTATVSVVWHTSPVQSIEAAKQKEIVIAASVPSNSSSFIPTALNDLISCRTIPACWILRSTRSRGRSWACSAAAPTSAARSWLSPASLPSARRRCARPS